MVTTSTSTSAPQPEMPKPAAAGLATITGLAILANPRIVHASKTLVLDAQFYLGLTNRDSLIGSLRYYNLRDYTFHDEATLYVVHATVSTRFVICFPTSRSVFSLLDENRELVCRFPGTEHIWITALSVTYDG